MKLIWRSLLLLLGPVVGAAAGFGLAYVLENGWINSWQPVAAPPELPAAIHAVREDDLWVADRSGRIYHNPAADTCAAECWTLVSEVVIPPPSDEVREVLPEACVRPPPLLGAAETASECLREQWVDYNTAVALGRDGSLRMWRFVSGGEWVALTYLFLMILGALAFFVVALVAVSGMWLVDVARRGSRVVAAA